MESREAALGSYQKKSSPPALEGLGIKGFSTGPGGQVVNESHDQSVVELTVPQTPDLLSSARQSRDVDRLIETPSRKSHSAFRQSQSLNPYTNSPLHPASSGSSTLLQTPSSPGLALSPYAQHGTSLHSFKAQSQIPSSPQLFYSHDDRDAVDGRSGSPAQSHLAYQRLGSTGSPGLAKSRSSRRTSGQYTQVRRMDTEAEEDERQSILPDLPMSPARLAFHKLGASDAQKQKRSSLHTSNQDQNSADDDADYDLMGGRNPEFNSPAHASSSNSRAHTANEGSKDMGDLEGNDTKVHARNLSLFFPQPGKGTDMPPPSTDAELVPISDIPPATKKRRPGGTSLGGGMNGFTFGAPPKSPLVGSDSMDSGKTASRRRGHHVSCHLFTS